MSVIFNQKLFSILVLIQFGSNHFPFRLPDELYTVLLTLIYLNAVSKLYSSREHIVTNFVSAPGQLCRWRYTSLLLLLLLLCPKLLRF